MFTWRSHPSSMGQLEISYMIPYLMAFILAAPSASYPMLLLALILGLTAELQDRYVQLFINYSGRVRTLIIPLTADEMPPQPPSSFSYRPQPPSTSHQPPETPYQWSNGSGASPSQKDPRTQMTEPPLEESPPPYSSSMEPTATQEGAEQSMEDREQGEEQVAADQEQMEAQETQPPAQETPRETRESQPEQAKPEEEHTEDGEMLPKRRRRRGPRGTRWSPWRDFGGQH